MRVGFRDGNLYCSVLHSLLSFSDGIREACSLPSQVEELPTGHQDTELERALSVETDVTFGGCPKTMTAIFLLHHLHNINSSAAAGTELIVLWESGHHGQFAVVVKKPFQYSCKF